MSNPRNEIVGTHLDQPIYKKLQQDDVTYIFDRLAECDEDGWCHLNQLSANEVMLKNGLIYRRPNAA